MRQRSEILISICHIFMLCSFAFAQPLFDLLARHAAFLVVHRAGLADMLRLIGLLCLLIPAGFIGLEFAARAVSAHGQKWMHYGNVAFLVGILSLPAVQTDNARSGSLVLGLAGGIGISVSVCYASFSAVRLFFTLLSPAILLFPAVFVLRAEIAPIMFSHTKLAPSLSQPGTPDAQTRNIPPVVFVVLDELPLTSLLDEHYRIDAVRYPHFAALAQNATWFRNAVTESGSTLVAVPTILSGTGPKPNALPTYEYYPHNIFTLLHQTHELHVFESHTMLCPESLCPEPPHQKAQLERFITLISDLSIVYLHIILPQDYTTFLPAVTQTWKDFGRATEAGVQTQTPDMETVLQKARQFYVDRAAAFSHFVTSITATAKPGLHVIHVLLPHVPWTYLPSGVVYTRSGRNVPGLHFETETWNGNAALVRQGYQRHLWQVELVDNLIGQLLSRLRAVDLYDQSLIIVTADHGASFWPNSTRRALFGPYAADVRRVPLFLKAPFQDTGAISDRRVSVVDIVPTIADILGIEPAGQFDGHSLYSVPIICANATPIRIMPQTVIGHVDLLEVEGEHLSIVGWAADLTQSEPAARILIFSNGRLLHDGVLNSERPDVVRVHHKENLRHSGFRYRLPVVPSISDSLRVFAVSHSGVASELRYSHSLHYPEERSFQKQSDRPVVLPLFEATEETCHQLPSQGSTFLAQMHDFSPAAHSVSDVHDTPSLVPPALAPLQASLERKLTLFTTGRASDSQTKALASSGQYQTLRGRSLQQLSIVGVSPLHATLDLTQQNFEVQLPVRFVPAHITGALTAGAERVAEQAILAIAINGTIQDVMPCFLGPQGKERFSFLVPENAFQVGPNEPAFFLISGQEAAPQLERVNFCWRPVD